MPKHAVVPKHAARGVERWHIMAVPFPNSAISKKRLCMVWVYFPAGFIGWPVLMATVGAKGAAMSMLLSELVLLATILQARSAAGSPSAY